MVRRPCRFCMFWMCSLEGRDWLTAAEDVACGGAVGVGVVVGVV